MNSVLDVADGAYPDGQIRQIWDEGPTDCGDTLALFILREMQDVLTERLKLGDPDKAYSREDFYEVYKAIKKARQEIEEVESALSKFAGVGPCDSCCVSMINGRRCHEHGCPESWRDAIRVCTECEEMFYPQKESQKKCFDCCTK